MRSDVPSSNWLKWMLLSDVAGYRPTGMFTSPKLRAPFQIVRGTRTKLPAQRRSTTLLQPFATLSPWSRARAAASSRPSWAGLAELGPVEPFSGDLSLELGISVWLRTERHLARGGPGDPARDPRGDPPGVRPGPLDRAGAPGGAGAQVRCGEPGGVRRGSPSAGGTPGGRRADGRRADHRRDARSPTTRRSGRDG